MFIRRVKEKESRILVHRQVLMTIREGEKILEGGVGLGLTRIRYHGRGQEDHDQDKGHYLSQNQVRNLARTRQKEGSHLSKQQFSFR